MNNRNRARTSSSSSSSDPQPPSSSSAASEENMPAPPLRILTDQEARENDVRCRFCFEGVSGDDDDDDDDEVRREQQQQQQDHRLVAPCNCTGSSEYVHVICLRQWQSYAPQTRAAICGVCLTRFSLAPVRQQLKPIPKGTLLLAKHEEMGTFCQSVILMLCGTDNDDLPFGVIVNRPSIQAWNSTDCNEEERNRHPNNTAVLARKGGPVCGGRLGVTRYMILHTQHEQADGNRWHSKTIFQAGSRVSLLCDRESIYDRESPALLESNQVEDFLQEHQNSNLDEDHSVLVFSGYCSWGRGQLEREVQRGMWDLSHGEEQDLLRDNPEGFWEELVHGNRLIQSQDMFVDDAG